MPLSRNRMKDLPDYPKLFERIEREGFSIEKDFESEMYIVKDNQSEDISFSFCIATFSLMDYVSGSTSELFVKDIVDKRESEKRKRYETRW